MSRLSVAGHDVVNKYWGEVQSPLRHFKIEIVVKVVILVYL